MNNQLYISHHNNSNEAVTLRLTSDGKGSHAIWRAVILQALLDSASQSKKKDLVIARQEAISWLTEQDDDFHAVCDLANFHPCRTSLAQGGRKAKRQSAWFHRAQSLAEIVAIQQRDKQKQSDVIDAISSTSVVSQKQNKIKALHNNKNMVINKNNKSDRSLTSFKGKTSIRDGMKNPQGSASHKEKSHNAFLDQLSRKNAFGKKSMPWNKNLWNKFITEPIYEERIVGVKTS